jgi:hypothetical protein
MAFDAGDIESKLTLDRSQWNRELQAAERQADEFEKKKRTAKIGLELDDTKAKADLEKFKRDLAGVRDAKVTLTLDVDKSKAELKKFINDISKGGAGNDKFKLSPELDETKIKAQVAALAKSLKGTFKLDADIDKLNAAATKISNVTADKVTAKSGTVDDIKGTAKYDVQLNSSDANAQANALAESMRKTVIFDVELRDNGIAGRLDEMARPRKVTYNVDVDAGAAAAQLGALGAVGNGIEETLAGVGDAAESGLGAIAQYAGIGAAALPPIATGIAAIPGLLMGLVVPAATIAVGMDGIKAAAVGLVVPFNDLKNAVSNTFQNGLEPAMQNTSRLFPVLTAGMQGTATALSGIAVNLTTVASSAEGVKNIETIFTNVNTLLASVSPSIDGLVANFLRLGAETTGALVPIGAMLLDVSTAWQHTISVITESGSAKEAIVGLVGAVMQLLKVIAPLTQLGVQLMAALGPALVGALSLVAGVVQTIADAFSLLPGPIQTAIAAFAAFKIAMSFIGSGAAAQAAQTTMMANAMRQAGVAGTAAAGGVGRYGNEAARAVPRATGLGGAIGRLGSAIGGANIAFIAGFAALSIFGTAMQEQQQRALESAQSVKTFGDALRDSGGAINNNVQQLIGARASALGMDQALTKAGVTTQGLSNVLSGTGMSVQDLSQKLLSNGNYWDQQQYAVDKANQTLRDNTGILGLGNIALSAQSELLSLFGTGAADAAQNAEKLAQEFDLGKAAATALSEAQSKLNENMVKYGETSSSANLQAAGYAASLAAITDDTKTAGEATKVAATYYGLASDGARNMATANMAAAGSLQNFGASFDGINPKIIQANGSIDLMAKGGIQLQSAAIDAAAGIDQLYGATLKATGSVVQAGTTAALARQRFIDMGVAAGVPRANMEALAASMMAIPKEVKTQVSLPGGAQAAVEALGLKDKITSIPNEKSVVVKALSQEAIATLEALGLKVTQLPDGQFLIKADGSPAITEADITAGKINGMKASLGIGAVDKGAKAFADNSKSIVDKMLAKMGLSAEDRGIASVVQGAKAGIDSTTGFIGLNAVDKGAKAFADNTKAGIDKLLGIMGINAADRGANAAVQGAKAGMDATVGTMGINALDRGAAAAANATKALMDSLVGIEGINAADRGAAAAANATKSLIDGLLGTEGISAVDRGAIAAAERIRATINAMVATIKVVAAVQGAAASVAGVFGAEGLIRPHAEGAIEMYAPGGMRSKDRMRDSFSKLMPMKANSAAIVGPSTWRVIGDRAEGDEAYIPINRSMRSRHILEETARRMGFDLIDLKSSIGKMWKQLLSGSKSQAALPGTDYQRPEGVPAGQWGWNTPTPAPNTVSDDVWKKVKAALEGSHYSQERIISAITEALRSRGIEHLTVQAPQGASVQEVVNEALFRIRHSKKGAHK